MCQSQSQLYERTSAAQETQQVPAEGLGNRECIGFHYRADNNINFVMRLTL